MTAESGVMEENRGIMELRNWSSGLSGEVTWSSEVIPRSHCSMMQPQQPVSDQLYQFQQRFPLQPRLCQGDFVNQQASRDSSTAWDRKIYADLQSSRYYPFNAEMRLHGRLPTLYSQTAQFTAVSVRASSEYGFRPSAEGPCDLLHNGHFTPPGTQHEMNPSFYSHHHSFQPHPPNGVAEPIFPPPMEMPPSQQPRQPNQVIPPQMMSFFHSQPPCSQLPAYYAHHEFMENQSRMLHERQIMSAQIPDQRLDSERKKTSRSATARLKAWLNDHSTNPYPTKAEKIKLAAETQLTFNQISTWFANARRRLKKENRMTWSPRTGATESRPRVPELVRGDNDEHSDGRSSSRLEEIFENDPPERNNLGDLFISEAAYAITFTNEMQQFERAYHNHFPPPPLPQPYASQAPPRQEVDAAAYGGNGERAIFCHTEAYIARSEDSGGRESRLNSV